MMTGLRAHTPYNGIFKNGKKVRRPTIQLTHGVGIYAGQRRVKRGKGHGDRRCNEPGGGGIYAWYLASYNGKGHGDRRCSKGRDNRNPGGVGVGTRRA